MNLTSLFAKQIVCTVESLIWLSSDVFQLRFVPNKKFEYEAGQFISVYVPVQGGKPVRRAYSLATPDRKSGYELLIKKAEGGLGSTFLSLLKPGDTFQATAPYGDFRFESAPARRVCLIATGTGLAPMLAFAKSENFLTDHVPSLIFGARFPQDILHQAYFEQAGFDITYCLSQTIANKTGYYSGRITDYIRSLPISYPFYATDFYICGIGKMLEEVTDVLVNARGVSRTSIFGEAFTASPPKTQVSPKEAA